MTGRVHRIREWALGMQKTRCITAAVLWGAWATASLGQEAGPPVWKDVLPIFQKRCINCHAAHGAAKGLRLDSYSAAISGGENGAVILPRNATESELVRRLRGQSTPRMPFLSTPLPTDEIELIVRWIEAGVPDGGTGD